MVTITVDQLKEIEYIINQSIEGNHILFDAESIRSAFFNESPIESHSLNSEDSKVERKNIEDHIERLISQPNLERKRCYLLSLDLGTLQQVVRSYFSIVENNLFESKKVLH